MEQRGIWGRQRLPNERGSLLTKNAEGSLNTTMVAREIQTNYQREIHNVLLGSPANKFSNEILA